MSRKAFFAVVLLGLAIPGKSFGLTTTFGSDLTATPNVTFGCETAPQLSFQNLGFYEFVASGQPSCTWRQLGVFGVVTDTHASTVPGDGTITSVSIKSGPNPAPLRVTVVRLLAPNENGGINSDKAVCCYFVGESGLPADAERDQHVRAESPGGEERHRRPGLYPGSRRDQRTVGRGRLSARRGGPAQQLRLHPARVLRRDLHLSGYGRSARRLAGRPRRAGRVRLRGACPLHLVLGHGNARRSSNGADLQQQRDGSSEARDDQAAGPQRHGRPVDPLPVASRCTDEHAAHERTSAEEPGVGARKRPQARRGPIWYS